MKELKKAKWSLAREYRGEELTELSALSQARLIAEGEVSSQELVELYLKRIEELDGELGAFVDVYADRALQEAERADKARSRGKRLGLFHGVPTAVKDHHMVRFKKTRLGSRAFEWLISPVDDGLVKRLRGAGFVIMGKTTMSELGLLPMVEPSEGRPTRNPWDLSRTAGGSSGGAGAAIGAGLLPLAPGSDGAGSVRIPSALNGLVGLKPSRGLVRDGSDRIDPYGLTVIGPMARDLDDLAGLLDVMADAGGTYLARTREMARPLRIGVVMEASFGEVAPEIQDLVEKAAALLKEAGHQIEWRNPPEGTLDEFTPLYQRFISRIPVVQSSKLEELTHWFREEGKQVSEQEAWRIYRKFEATGNDAMAGIDVMITPTVGVIAPKVGEFSGLPPAEYFRGAAPLGTFTALANITGQPGLSVPFGEARGLPVGMQLLGRRGDDLLLIRLARVFEEAMGRW